MNSKKLDQFSVTMHATGGVCTVAIVAVMYITIYRSLDAEKRETADSIAVKQQFLSTAESITASHEELQQQLSDEEARLISLLERIPPTPQESEFLAQLAKLAHRSGLSIQKFSRGTATDERTHSGMEVRLSAQASHEAICRFLAGLADLRRLCHVRQLSVMAPTESGSDYPIESTLRIFFAPLRQATADEVL